MIEPGTKVIIDGPETMPTKVQRLYGVVVNVGAARVCVQTADGATHTREPQFVAVFVKSPANWEHLFQAVELFAEVKPSLVEHSKRPRRRSSSKANKATAPA